MYRPKLHFTPKNNWMNDPNGLVCDEETNTVHMYYQYCLTLAESEKYWGHAVSNDFVHWKEEEPTIAPDTLGSIWSGSAVIDRNNTSGFFDSVNPGSRIVAFFTYAGGDMSYGFQKQGVAYSLDGGFSFEKYEGNPVIQGIKDGEVLYDNRDPKVIWYPDESLEQGGIWVMIIAGMRARIFVSHNLKDWIFSSEPSQRDGKPLESECPDLFPIRLNGDKDNIKWVFCGAGRFYVIGNLIKTGKDKYEFNAETDKIEPMHGSDDMYAAQTYYNDLTLNRRIGIYWLVDKTAEKIPGKTWDGAQSIALEYRLVMTQNGPRISIYPIKEIESLRERILLLQQI